MELVKPRPLMPGDRIGIVATSSPVTAAELDRLAARLGQRGYPVRVADGVLDRDGYLAGSAERRAAGVRQMFADPEVALVMPASGGTGASHLVDLLDYTAIRVHPKLFTGFSNPSVLNNAILAAAGLPSVHGISGFQFFGWPTADEPTEAAFWRMVTGPIAPDKSPDDLVLRCVQGEFPVITGVGFGHQQSKILFPVGCRVEFDLSGPQPVLRYLEDLIKPWR